MLVYPVDPTMRLRAASRRPESRYAPPPFCLFFSCLAPGDIMEFGGGGGGYEADYGMENPLKGGGNFVGTATFEDEEET